MRPSPDAQAGFVAAFRELASRLACALEGVPTRLLPVQMYVAGGAAVHLYLGERVSADVDAVFSRRFALPENLEVSYRDADGRARMLYFDRQYNDTFGLLHEDAHDDAIRLELDGVDAAVLDVRLLAPVDLAVTKIARLADPDRSDLAALARAGLVSEAALRTRAEEAVGGYVGDVARLQTSIELACRLVAEHATKGKRPKR